MGGGEEKERKEKKRKEIKLINPIHTAIIMTFRLILDVMTTTFAACTATVLIRMETALLIKLLFQKVYLMSFCNLSLNICRWAGSYMGLTG